MKYRLICIECPMGCAIEAEKEGDTVVSVAGNSCPRGKLYAENEVICPMRVVTSTVRATDGRMLPVKTNKPVKKSEIFSVMKKINAQKVTPPVRIGEVICRDISDGADLVAAGELL